MERRIEFVQKPCPVCLSERYSVLYPDTLGNELPYFDYDFRPEHHQTYRIVRCLDCTHGYSSPIPANMHENYEEVQDDRYLVNETQRVETAKKTVQYLLKYVPGGRLLDVGCATGDFLSVARDFYHIEGIELSRWSGRIAGERGLVVHNVKLDAFYPDNLYDVVTLWGVIEHFEKPADEIAQVHRILKPGGFAALWTGNMNCILFQFLGKKWWWIQGQHIQLFTHQSLRKLFAQKGFEEAFIGVYPYTTTLRSIMYSLGRYPLISRFARMLLNNKYLSDVKVVLMLPGEMFAIFRKL